MSELPDLDDAMFARTGEEFVLPADAPPAGASASSMVRRNGCPASLTPVGPRPVARPTWRETHRRPSSCPQGPSTRPPRRAVVGAQSRADLLLLPLGDSVDRRRDAVSLAVVPHGRQCRDVRHRAVRARELHVPCGSDLSCQRHRRLGAGCRRRAHRLDGGVVQPDFRRDRWCRFTVVEERPLVPPKRLRPCGMLIVSSASRLSLVWCPPRAGR